MFSTGSSKYPRVAQAGCRRRSRNPLLEQFRRQLFGVTPVVVATVADATDLQQAPALGVQTKLRCSEHVPHHVRTPEVGAGTIAAVVGQAELAAGEVAYGLRLRQLLPQSRIAGGGAKCSRQPLHDRVPERYRHSRHRSQSSRAVAAQTGGAKEQRPAQTRSPIATRFNMTDYQLTNSNCSPVRTTAALGAVPVGAQSAIKRRRGGEESLGENVG